MSSQCQDSVIDYAGRGRAPRSSFSTGLVSALEAIERLMQRHRERQTLSAMDERMLRDIGVTRADVDHEINKPFWRP